MNEWRIYTDGACSQKSGAGGWAFIIDDNQCVREFFGPSKGPTTNNRMELAAIYGALLQVPTGQAVNIHTDSKYCQQALTIWWRNWQRNGWQTKDGKPVENKALIEKTLEEIARVGKVTLIHVERNSSPRMCRADELAKDGKKQYQNVAVIA